MVIAVNITSTDAYQQFIDETFSRITAHHPEHYFIFIFDKPFNLPFGISENVVKVLIPPEKISLFSRLRNNNHKIAALLKRHKTDVFVTKNALLQTTVPQCVIAYDTFTSKDLKKVKNIVTTSEFSKKQIIEKNNIRESRIDVVYKGVNESQQITVEEKEKIKQQYANGNEYFLVTGTIPLDKFIILLKAFSLFKKMQKSNMQLLVVSAKGINKELLEALRLFKFNSEVKMLDHIDKKENIRITGSAYAYVHLLEHEYLYALNAMSCHVPVIADNTGLMPEICSDSALYFNYNAYKEISDKMMLIYKDENLRKQLIEKAEVQVKKYSWDRAAKLLWKSIEKACL
ncbi:MAG TPA: glycosyltransferase [Chitinophagaceae bacterium]|nr:glycosyltransferase [Chitinophagaceae bacterium]